MKLGLLLKAYRKDTGKSLADLGREIGIERTALFRLESGQNVNVSKWRAIIVWLLT